MLLQELFRRQLSLLRLSKRIQVVAVHAGASLSALRDEMVELSNGCVCCTLREDMLEEIVRCCLCDSFVCCTNCDKLYDVFLLSGLLVRVALITA